MTICTALHPPNHFRRSLRFLLLAPVVVGAVVVTRSQFALALQPLVIVACVPLFFLCDCLLRPSAVRSPYASLIYGAGLLVLWCAMMANGRPEREQSSAVRASERRIAIVEVMDPVTESFTPVQQEEP